MDLSRADVALGSFLKDLPQAKRSSLEKFLPASQQKALEDISFFSSIKLEDASFEMLLEEVHWSWLLPILKRYTGLEQNLFLSILSPQRKKHLAKALTLSSLSLELPSICTSFLKIKLLNELIDPYFDLLPISSIVNSRLRPLLNFKKARLIQLIDRLSLHDLVLETRQIVETKILKKIYSLLTEEERLFLKSMAQYQDPVPLGKLGLEKWDGSEKSLRALLHKRGLIRMGAALHNEDRDLIWHLCHSLDIGRGARLEELAKTKTNPSLKEAMIKQIEEYL